MNKNESFLDFSKVNKTKKDSSSSKITGITRKLLEKYKSKTDFLVMDSMKKEKEAAKVA